MKNFITKKYRHADKKGFTLVEILVSVALFSVVMIMVATMLLSIVDANAKAQTLKVTLDNLNVALENMSRSIRLGTDYQGSNACSGNSTPNCFNTFSFTLPQEHDAIYTYALDGSTGNITRQISPTDPNPIPVTADNVDVTSLKFFLHNAGGVSGQPYVVIVLTGSAAGFGARPSAQTSFNLELTVSARQ